MGKDNRARRKAKMKNRAKAQARSDTRDRVGAGGPAGSTWDRPPLDDVDLAVDVLMVFAQGQLDGDQTREALATLTSMRESTMARASEMALAHVVDLIWSGGWQPAELLRQGKRGCATAAGARLVALAIAVDHAGRRAATLDHRWLAQVQSLDLPATTGRSGWVRAWSETEALDRSAALEVVLDALGNLFSLPRLPEILPPPGAGPTNSHATQAEEPIGAESDPVLDRIRGLLAKAESSTFDAEAEAFTAKAQELMTRHAVDAARLRVASAEPGRQPVLVRLPIEAPYADAKSILLQTVALANRCRTVRHQSLGLSTLVGMADDAAATEVLFTSLLIQAQAALGDAARRAPAGTRPRSQAFRSSFLLAYAGRIGERLEETNAAVLAEEESERGSAFLPVLRSEADVIDAEVADRFGELTSSRVRGGYDPSGHASGRAAGDRARLDGGALPGRT